MKPILKLLDSSIGQKVVAAATGIGLVAFVVAHMAGNLQLFLGPESLNKYAVKLKSLGALLWIARIGLVALIGLHIAMTIRARQMNKRAQASRYAVADYKASTWSSRHMALSGTVILAFVIFHLMHFTLGWIQPELYHLTDAKGRHDVYSMVVAGFQNWAIAAFYLVAMFFLFTHLQHATYSALQTLGLAHIGQDALRRRIAKGVAIATVLGFVSIPLSIVFGWFPAS